MSPMRRVRRPTDKGELLTRLVDSNPFSTFREALIFAAALGYSHDRRSGFDKSDEAIPWEVFSGAQGTELIDMIAATSDDDLEILGDDEERSDQRLQLFEEYANGGLEVLQEHLAQEARPEVDVVLDLVLSAREASPEGGKVDLTSIADELSG